MPEVTNPANYCCDNGNFGEPHECQKQPGATPAPSQPAGAREDDAEELYRVSRRGFEQFKVALAAYLAQQTAAKDALIRELREKLESRNG